MRTILGTRRRSTATATVYDETRLRAARALLRYVEEQGAESAADFLNAIHDLETAELVLRVPSQRERALRLVERTS